MRCCLCNRFVKKEDVENVRLYDGYAHHVHCADTAFVTLVEYLDEHYPDREYKDMSFRRTLFQAFLKHRGLIGKVTIPQFVDDYIRQNSRGTKARGGARPGAGRPSIGKYRSVGMTLPDDDWGFIDQLVDKGEYSSRAEYFRHLHEMNMLHVAMVKELNQ